MSRSSKLGRDTAMTRVSPRHAWLILIAFVWLAPPQALAHDADYALTSIDWNARTSALEIVHRIHTHQAIDAAALTLGASNPDLSAPKTLAALGLYVEQNFDLFDGQGQRIAPTFIGTEIEGDYTVIYHEAPLPAMPTALGLRYDVLADLRASQINHVNITLGGETRTLIFGPDSRRAVLGVALP